MPAGSGRSGKHSPGSATAVNAEQGQGIIPNGSVLRPQDLAICPGLITPGVLS
jgi:hypothetical protein